jgi:transcriptional regulator with XRE-family HTH domain
VGRFIRRCRSGLGWRQVGLAARAAVSQQEVSLVERGHFDGVPLRILRGIARQLDASLELDVRWRGGGLDRLLDEGHAALVGGASDLLRAYSWETRIEVTYAEYGERGSIDILAWHAASRILLVVEVKTELTSVEATLRKHDEKARLAPRVAAKREGWAPGVVARLLVLPDTSTSRAGAMSTPNHTASSAETCIFSAYGSRMPFSPAKAAAKSASAISTRRACGSRPRSSRGSP